MSGQAKAAEPDPPSAAKEPQARAVHGDIFVDDYEWMRDTDSARARAHIDAENAWTEARTAPMSGLRRTLFDEFKNRIQQTDLSVPVRMDGWWYFARTAEGLQYGLQCRVPVTDKADWRPPRIDPSSAPGSLPGEQVYFDANKEAEGKGFFSIGAMDVSKDGSLLLYSTDTRGDERYDIRCRVIGDRPVLGVEPGHDLPGVIEGVASGGCLTPDGRWIFYTKLDAAWRPWTVWRHRVGTPVVEDAEAWNDPDERFFVGVGMSFDEKSIVVTSASKTTSEVLRVPVDDPTARFDPVIPRQDGVDYDMSFARFERGAAVDGEDIPLAVVVHNRADPNFEVDVIDLRSEQPPYRIGDGVCIARGSTAEDDPGLRVGQRIEGIEFYRDYVVLSYRREGMTRLAVVSSRQAAADFQAGRPWAFRDVLPGKGLGGLADLDPVDHGVRGDEDAAAGAAASVAAQRRVAAENASRISDMSGSASRDGSGGRLWSIGSVGSPSYEAPFLRYSYGSYTMPPQVHELDPSTGEDVLLRAATVLGDFDPANYSERRVWVPASDGVRVPVSLVWRTDRLSAPAPMFITGYGAYESSSDPGFSVGRLSLLDRGVLYAVAHVRGGGEMGRQWYEQGKGLSKKNTFTDFIAATRWLEDNGWADPARTVANGGSAGGLLMGAIVNMAPGLYRGVEADVPFVDALTSILDPSLPLTVTEWDEWGDPLHDPAVYRYMKSYSPYENVLTAEQRRKRFGSAAMPSVFVTTSLNDTRVLPVEPLKWVARLQEPEVGADAILKVETDLAGHGGASGRYRQWAELAYENAWCLWTMGIRE